MRASRGGLVVPELLDERRNRHDLVRVQQEGGQYAPRHRGGRGHVDLVIVDLDGSEHCELHGPLHPRGTRVAVAALS